MQRTIKFKAPTWHSTLGSFGSGDIGRNIDPAMAAHLVENGIADYADIEPAAEPVQTPAPAAKTAAPRVRRAPRGQGHVVEQNEGSALPPAVDATTQPAPGAPDADGAEAQDGDASAPEQQASGDADAAEGQQDEGSAQ